MLRELVVVEKYFSSYMLVADGGYWCEVSFEDFIGVRVGQLFTAKWNHSPRTPR